MDRTHTVLIKVTTLSCPSSTQAHLFFLGRHQEGSEVEQQ